jgi:trk system potassium uptake protein
MYAPPVNMFKPVLYIIGIFLVALSFFMIIPALVNFFTIKNEWLPFLQSALLSLLIGSTLVVLFRVENFSLFPRQMFLLTTLTWIGVSMVAALPLVIIENISFTDAFFETMSGVTTTGSTIFPELSKLSPGILIWRSLLQWVGGIGFIVMAVAVLPFLRVGAMRLFHTESSDWSSKITARTATMAKLIFVVYCMITVLGVLCFQLAGMTFFDAINHAMTTVSTAGFSTHDNSFAYFEQPAIHWVAVVFMILGSLPFALYVRMMHGDLFSLFRDQQVRAFVFFLVASTVILTIWMVIKNNTPLLDAFRLTAFNIVSVVTTTGYALTDYTVWGYFSVVMFFFLTFVGGCSGSSAGGIKIFRFQVAYIILRNHMRQLLDPSIVYNQKYNGHTINEDIFRSLVGFSFFFAVTVALLALALSLFGYDLVTSLSGAATAVANVGPGLGDIIGPAGNFSSLHEGAKWLLALGMLMGRLEIITVLVLLTPGFWKS